MDQRSVTLSGHNVNSATANTGYWVLLTIDISGANATFEQDIVWHIDLGVQWGLLGGHIDRAVVVTLTIWTMVWLIALPRAAEFDLVRSWITLPLFSQAQAPALSLIFVTSRDTPVHDTEFITAYIPHGEVNRIMFLLVGISWVTEQGIPFKAQKFCSHVLLVLTQRSSCHSWVLPNIWPPATHTDKRSAQIRLIGGKFSDFHSVVEPRCSSRGRMAQASTSLVTLKQDLFHFSGTRDTSSILVGVMPEIYWASAWALLWQKLYLRVQVEDIPPDPIDKTAMRSAGLKSVSTARARRDGSVAFTAPSVYLPARSWGLSLLLLLMAVTGATVHTQY